MDSQAMRKLKEKIEIPVLLINQKYIDVIICEEMPGTLCVIDEYEAKENSESPYQLIEGKSYEYYCPEEYELEKSGIIHPSKFRKNTGYIVTNTYVGTLEASIIHRGTKVGRLTLEICSGKTGYREDYRRMLEDITGKCTDLLMRHTSPVYQNFTVDIGKDSQTIYQRFAFVNSLIRSEMFKDAINRINIMPVKKWETTYIQADICKVRRVNSSVLRQLILGNRRSSISEGHPLAEKFLALPERINITGKKETTDIPENRFIKYVIETFLQFCSVVSLHSGTGERLKKETSAALEILTHYLTLPVFREVSRLEMIPIHSPVLQRKGGYREILQSYLMFDVAARLVWSGGEEVYNAGKRDVAVLYEYWVFFKLLDLMEDVFGIKPISTDDLIHPKGAGSFELILKQGHEKLIDGIFNNGDRNFHVEFYYNHTFTFTEKYPEGGSWTRNMRPDFTLSIRPAGLSRREAEEKEMIMHIHFDAKYTIDSYESIFQNTESIAEKPEIGKGNYQRAGLLKMHAYKDAIRRTAGAYILYPGTENKLFKAFHEILPGIGAFAVSPRNTEDSGLNDFLREVVKLFRKNDSQLEILSHRIFETFRKHH